MTNQAQKNFHTVSDFTNVVVLSWLVMLVVGLIGIQHMQSVIKGFFFFFFSKIATILVIWKLSDRETPS